MAKILVVEDQQHFVDLINDWLSAEGYLVDCASTGSDALRLLKQCEYDLIVLDVNLPAVSGLDVCRAFRHRGGTTPIIMLTVNQTIDDKEFGFDAGADDYLTKPFHVRELSARVKALLKRGGMPQQGSVLRAGTIEVNPQEHKVTKDGVTIDLMPKEFALLEFLMKHPNQVFNADTLVQRVWPSSSQATPETIRSHITRIRQKLSDDSLIVTVHGLGYKLRIET
ncbi:MAG TPA: response regulator transcription factor [Trichormus sp.]|jgi:DNA-binding response OmpR family regulator